MSERILKGSTLQDKVIKDEYLASYLVKILKLKYQLQGLGEIISESKLTTCILNALPSH